MITSGAHVVSEVVMKRMKAAMILMVAILAVVNTAVAAPVKLGSITGSLEAPSRVALDAQGNLYVSETTENRVTKFSAEGAKVASISVPRPYGLAVDAAGTLYVCSVQVPQRTNNYVNKSAVLTFAADMTPTGTLGAAVGEFGAPVDIDIDGSGAIYVVDMKNGLVKVFDAQGALQYTIGTSYLRQEWTKGIAINDATGEVFVTDTAKISVQGNPVDSPRVMVFSKNGSFLRSFGQFGSEAGNFMAPVELALDRAGTLYVSDRGNNVVYVMNPADGTLIGEGGISAEISLPVGGIATSKNNLLYVAWSPTSSYGRVDIYGLDGFITMKAAPAALQFEGRQFSANPPAQNVEIINAGSGTLNWTASADQAWILLGQQVAAAPGSTANLAIGVDTSKLTAGSYQGKVAVTADYGQTTEIGVSLTVVNPLVLSISNGSPSFSVMAGSAAVSQTVTIGVGGGSGSWSLGTAGLPAWLSVSPTSGGAAASKVVFTANPAGLAAQAEAYTAAVPVSATGVTGDGTMITVSLKVNASSRISVTTNRGEAAFKITGPATFTGTGTSWSAETAPAGDYTVTFEGVAGFRRPFTQTKTLEATGSISFNGAYASFADLAAKKSIVAAKGPDAANDSQVKAFKNNGTAVDFDLLALATSSGASIAVGDVDGDGAADIIVGAGSGQSNPATVRVFRTADKSMIAEFTPFNTLNGAGVAAGDIDGDGKAEVLVSDNLGRIDVCTYVNGKLAATGIRLGGSAAAVADTAYDGKPEVVTVSKNGLKIWSVDLAAGTATRLANRMNLPGTSVAAGDFDGDGTEEILIGGMVTAAGSVAVHIVDAFGTREKLVAMNRASATVAAADLDGDGIAEAIVGIPDESTKGATGYDAKRATVHVYGADGVRKFAFRAFTGDEAKYGVNVAVGDLGL